MKKTQAAKQILKKQDITTWFQPIVNIETGELLGWEAFSRGPSIGPCHDSAELFSSAAEAGILKPLDLMCLNAAAKCFDQLQLEKKLFVNLSNEMLVASGRLKEQIGKHLADDYVPPTRMVLEIDESSAIKNIKELIDTVQFFQEQGFEIAVDNLGGSNTSQNLWQQLNPDFVKIDRRFIQGIDTEPSKQAYVQGVVATARSVNARVIAEGVETENELVMLKHLGIQLMQGYLIQRPELAPLPPKLEELLSSPQELNISNANLACDLVVTQDKVTVDTTVESTLKIFEDKIFLNSLAVVDNDQVMGMVYRAPFLEKLSKRQRRDVIIDKPISSEMDTDFLAVDSHIRIEQVSRLVTARASLHANLDFVVTSQNKFLGIGTVIDLLRKITELRVSGTGQANLLTMLPGNIPIGDCVNKLLEKGEPFTIALLDLTNFKPFNNHYGHNKGDELLVIFADLLRKHINSETDFAGHIGGDDFIVVMQAESWQKIFISLFNEFNHRVVSFYSESDQAQGGIHSSDRFGKDCFFSFVSVSAGVLSITDEYFDSFQTLLTALIKLKQRTKRDSAVCVAHQYKDSLALVSFVDEELKEISVE